MGVQTSVTCRVHSEHVGPVPAEAPPTSKLLSADDPEFLFVERGALYKLVVEMVQEQPSAFHPRSTVSIQATTRIVDWHKPKPATPFTTYVLSDRRDLYYVRASKALHLASGQGDKMLTLQLV